MAAVTSRANDPTRPLAHQQRKMVDENFIVYKHKIKKTIISNTMTLEKLVIKCPRKPREDLFTNPPSA